MTSGPVLEVCFTPASLASAKPATDRIVVVVDILRATTAMCVAFGYGVKSVIPLPSVSEAEHMKGQGWMVAGENEGLKLPFADYGNSPVEFRNSDIAGHELVYCTTNGTRAIHMAKDYGQVVIASFVNLEAVCGWLSRQDKPVLILCSGWKDRFSLEDAIFAGAMSDMLVNAYHFLADSDEAMAAIMLWRKSSRSLMATVSRSSHYLRLLGIENRRRLKYCLFPEKFMVVPALLDGKLVNVYDRPEGAGL